MSEMGLSSVNDGIFYCLNENIGRGKMVNGSLWGLNYRNADWDEDLVLA